MAEKITYAWIEQRIKKCIDQHFQDSQYIGNKERLNERRVPYIGGILQAALHLLPTDRYFECCKYCYYQHGYDPGGVADGGQKTLEMWIKEKNE